MGSVAFLCHPYHRGGVTGWMADAAWHWARDVGPAIFIAPLPRRPFRSAGNSPIVRDLFQTRCERLTTVFPDVGEKFELGTIRFRASNYAKWILAEIPAGTPIVPSDDPAAWQAAAWLAARNPFVFVVHSDDEVYYRALGKYAERVAAVVPVSKRVNALTTEGWARKARPVRAIIPCGVPVGPVPLRLHRSAGISLIWIGRYEERQKRISDLPRILAGVQARGLSCRLVIVGGSDTTLNRAPFDDAGVADEVAFVPWLDREAVQRKLGESDILLLPSNFEGWPRVVMEALGAGCGVVASRVSGVEDLEHDPRAKDCLWLHAVGDVDEAVVKVLEAAKVDPMLRATRARALAEAELSIEACVARYNTLFESFRDFVPRPPRRLDVIAGALSLSTSPVVSTARSIRHRFRRG